MIMKTSRAYFLRATLCSSLGLLVVGGGAAGATYAYFGARAEAKTHVKAGSVKADIRQIYLWGDVTENDDTYLVKIDETHNNRDVDLVANTDVVFNVSKAIPGLDAHYGFKVQSKGTVESVLTFGLQNLQVDMGDTNIVNKNFVGGEDNTIGRNQALSENLLITVRVLDDNFATARILQSEASVKNVFAQPNSVNKPRWVVDERFQPASETNGNDGAYYYIDVELKLINHDSNEDNIYADGELSFDLWFSLESNDVARYSSAVSSSSEPAPGPASSN